LNIYKETEVVKLIIKSDLVSPPFTFNPMKHHLGFMRDFINKAELLANEAEIFGLINNIGPQVTDIYCGLLSLEQLIDAVRSQLIDKLVFRQEAYDEWVHNYGRNYNFLELADGSKWTFRRGEKTGRYIHFHPARTNSALRIRGTTLRTAMGLKIIAGQNLLLYKDKEFINMVRQHRLQLSPIKSLSDFSAINRILDLLGSDEIIGDVIIKM
jgi:hypothetical protein